MSWHIILSGVLYPWAYKMCPILPVAKNLPLFLFPRQICGRFLCSYAAWHIAADNSRFIMYLTPWVGNMEVIYSTQFFRFTNLPKHYLFGQYHTHKGQVSLQLIRGYTCPIWMQFKACNEHFLLLRRLLTNKARCLDFYHIKSWFCH